MLRLLDLSFDDPAENLAVDEALLNAANARPEPAESAMLRFWESPRSFVVLGTAQALREEAHEEHCAADGVPILRRCTGGGCVLQGPGSLNYSLVLPLARYPDVRTIHRSYRHILGRIAAAFGQRGVAVRHEDTCDLAVDGLKVSGNAQRRKQHALLHHGTLVYRPDYPGMVRYLREPAERPAYRGGRRHSDFVGALPFTPEELREILREAFNAKGPAGTLRAEERHAAEALIRARYANRDWVHRK